MITTLKSHFPKTVIGYSDHTLGNHAAICSVAMGARIVEKHFTLDKNYSDFRDHQISCNPTEMKEMVRIIREIEPMLGAREEIVEAQRLAREWMNKNENE